MKKRHIIIGSSAAGIGALSRLRKLAPNDEIMCLTAQAEMPYNTCLLADYLSEGQPPTTLWTRTADFFEQNDITLHCNTLVERVDTANKKVMCADNVVFDYDTLFIGTGTSQRWLPTTHPATSGLFGFQTLRDTIALDTFIKDEKPNKAIVIGAGLSGLECADALNERGIQVTVIEYGSHVLPTLINKGAAHSIVEKMQKATTTVLTSTGVAEILVDKAGRTHGVTTTNDQTISADMVVVAIGATPNIALANNAGLTITNGGIEVDEYMTTSDPNIFAGGDVATVSTRNGTEKVRSCTWPDAMQQGMFAARAMAGKAASYPGVTIVLSSHFYGTQFVSCGPVVNPPKHYEQIERSDANGYRLFLIEDNILKGFLLVGELDNIGALRRLVNSGEAVDHTLFKSEHQ